MALSDKRQEGYIKPMVNHKGNYIFMFQTHYTTLQPCSPQWTGSYQFNQTLFLSDYSRPVVFVTYFKPPNLMFNHLHIIYSGQLISLHYHFKFCWHNDTEPFCWYKFSFLRKSFNIKLITEILCMIYFHIFFW